MKKLLYTIGEVAGMLGEEVSTIRYWSETFPKYVKPERNGKGNRLFHPEDLENIKLIQHLTRDEGLTLDGVARRLAVPTEGLDSRVAIADRLRKIRATLSELHDNL